MTERPNLEDLAEHLRVLGNPNRLELLYQLRSPSAVREIELTPEKVREGENPQRPISEQAVRDHLEKLRSLGLVAVERGEREGRIVDEHVLDHQSLFAVVEELRSLGELKAEDPVPTEETFPDEREAPGEKTKGPRFVLVRGQQEGRVFPLRSENLSADRGWVIGRKRGLAVSLDYDPFVSAENAEVVMDGGGFKVLDLRNSRNGTVLNYERLPRGGEAALEHGDIVSVGRTSLVFRTD